MLNLTQLTPDSTLGDLASFDVQISANALARELSEIFDQQPALPGVIIPDLTQGFGMISRRKFLERMSQPFSLELYLKRPVQVFSDSLQLKPLQLPYGCKIDQAAQMALSRLEGEMYEPILVMGEQKKLSLLGINDLLLAQSHILTLVNNVIQQQKMEADRFLKRLKQEQEKVKEYTKILEKRQAEDKERNQLLELQKLESLKKSKEIEQLNQRFIRIGQLLSLEGKRAFQATFDGVNAICDSTTQVVKIGKSLNTELETVHNASRLIARVSQQVRHLSMQAAVVANQSGGQLQGFSNITSEIGKLVTETFEAGGQMNQVATRFQVRIQELTESAQEGESVARSLIQKIERAENALAELEALVLDQNQNTDSLSVSSQESENN
ncbi:MAG: hypothetical protein VKJ46_15220 [Leptolyngbyaceae bacterium]|nr:hypothetical protein [Leptolyngbyaceae bacterium]